jgi:large subunit ribosomal protein L3
MAHINEKVSKGLLGTKLGMTQVWDENGKLVPVTVIEVPPTWSPRCARPSATATTPSRSPTARSTPQGQQAPDGPLRGRGRDPRRHLTEVRTADAADYSLGQELTVDATFEAGQLVDVVGTSKGKGTAGVMKRHNFKGVSASHGAHRNHRKPGSIGASSTPSRVFKGMRMAGRMGGERVTVLNLTVHAVDAEKGLLLVKGAVPGARGRIVYVRNAVKGA